MKSRPKVAVTAEAYGRFFLWTFRCAECNEAGSADHWEYAMEMAWGHVCFGHWWEPCS